MAAQRRSNLVSRYDLVRGLRMHARVGSSTAPAFATPLIFIHGLGASVRYLEPTMQCLADRYRVAGVDLPGFGRTQSPDRTLGVRALAETLAAWLDVNEVGPAVFIANSFGCQVIVELATIDRPRVSGLVLNAPTMDPAHRTALGQLIRVIADIPREPFHLAWIVFLDYLRAGPLRLLDTLRIALADHIEEKLPDLPMPTLVVTGRRDPVVTVRWASEVARLVGLSVPGAAGGTLSVVQAAAHALPFDDPETLASLIHEFVARVEREATPA